MFNFPEARSSYKRTATVDSEKTDSLLFSFAKQGLSAEEAHYLRPILLSNNGCKNGIVMSTF